MSDTPHTRREENEGVLVLTLDRPAKGNAISHEIFDALATAVADMARRDDLRVMLIRAEGRFFSTGVDLATMTVPEMQGSTSGFRGYYRSNARHDVFDAMEALEKPVIVAHQAACLGAGLEMSLSADFRLAGRSASYGLPELKLGMIAGSGGTSRLTRIVGPHWARWLSMATETVSAEQALAIGLVHEVLEDDALDARARALAAKLARQPREAMAMAKLAIELTTDLGRAQGRTVERLANSTLYFGREREETMAAMMERMKKKA